jgi:hypothetical protein
MKPNLAIDFDDTIVKLNNHEIIGLNHGVKEAILKLKEYYNIVIYSSRNVAGYEREFEEMKKYLKANDIYYDSIVEREDGKVMAMFYVDDKAIEFKDNWNSITNRLLDTENKNKAIDFANKHQVVDLLLRKI